MSAKQVHPLPVPRQWQSLISRIRSTLRAHDLLDVLESLPLASSFTFHEATTLKQKAIRFHIGFRKQSDEAEARAWAYILLGPSEIDPPILFRDEVLPAAGSDSRTQVFPRAASSLLRTAGELFPPFCFLQVDPDDKATNVRGMICSVVAYYALASGLTDCAMKWSRFESSLAQALQYIESRAEYQQWLVEPGQEPDDSTIDEHMPDAEEAPTDVHGRVKECVDDVNHHNAPMEDGM